MIETRITAAVHRLKRMNASERKLVSSLIVTFLGVTFAVIPARGQAPLKDGEKARPGRLLVLVDERPQIDPAKVQFKGFWAAEPESNAWSQIGDPDLVDGVFSSDARFLAAGRSAGAGAEKVGVWVYDLAAGSPGRRVFDRPFFSCSWANDGKQLFVSASMGALKFETYRLNVDGSNKTKLPIPESEVVMDCSPDGTWLASYDFTPVRERRARINVMRTDGTESHAILNEPGGVARNFRFSPDGRKLAYGLSTGELRQTKSTVWVVDRNGQNRTQVPLALEPGIRCRPFWSPDGTRLAVGLSEVGVRGGERIVIVDLDGKNLKTLPPPPWGIKLLDWR
jgi:dipeptidyl aminopeptidase/acylaminoacyl peptidase